MADDNTYLSPQSYRDREARKFREDADGNVAIKTISEIIGAIEGTFTPSGARAVLAVTELPISSSAWTEIVLEKAQRNGLNIQNRSSTQDNGLTDVFVSGSNTDTATPIPVGMKIVQGAERQYAISEVAIYVKAKSGSPIITIEALG